jgi:hypothetical protein
LTQESNQRKSRLQKDCSFLSLDVKKGTERKIKAAKYFGVHTFTLAHAIQLVVRPALQAGSFAKIAHRAIS